MPNADGTKTAIETIDMPAAEFLRLTEGKKRLYIPIKIAGQLFDDGDIPSDPDKAVDYMLDLFASAITRAVNEPQGSQSEVMRIGRRSAVAIAALLKEEEIRGNPDAPQAIRQLRPLLELLSG